MMHDAKIVPFDPLAFLANAGKGRRIVHFKTKGVLFSQGGAADSVFFIQKGTAKLTVVSEKGKEATITLLAAGDFIGEESIAISCCRLATATALSACSAMKIERTEIMRVIREEPKFSTLFLDFILTRGMKTHADLVDQLFNSSEKRLARILLLLANYNKPGEAETMIPKISQQTLAEMIGTTRSRVSFFMNRFRKQGFLEYNGRIHVNKSLLNVVLYDQVADQNASKPAVFPKKAKIERLVSKP
jgi:CRP/FNR family cyclic AMP-dependent transcriptional regulator